MNKYRYVTEDGSRVEKYLEAVISEGGVGWRRFQEYLENGGEVDPWRTAQEILDAAYKEVLGGIEEKKKEENKKLFTYNGVKFVSDKDSIQATQNDALARPSNDPISTMEGTPYEGNWMCDSGSVPFTNEEFIAFAAEYFLRGSANFTARTMHKASVDAIYNTEGVTSEDILSYDFLTGWYINL